jgi:hypothetical protein
MGYVLCQDTGSGREHGWAKMPLVHIGYYGRGLDSLAQIRTGLWLRASVGNQQICIRNVNVYESQLAVAPRLNRGGSAPASSRSRHVELIVDCSKHHRREPGTVVAVDAFAAPNEERDGVRGAGSNGQSESAPSFGSACTMLRIAHQMRARK